MQQVAAMDAVSVTRLTASKVEGVSVAVLGGDDRERLLITGLLAAGYRVLLAGRDVSAPESAAGAESVPPEAALRARAIVGPMAGIAADGRVWSRPPHPGLSLEPAVLEGLPPGVLWASGKVQWPLLAALLAREANGLHFVDLSEHDVLAVLNAVPSAEGAIMMAMQGSPFCLHRAHSIVCGFGRTAQTLAILLDGLRSRVTVVARSAAARARAQAMGYAAAGFDALGDLAGQARFCFNTVPAPVLTAGVLHRASRDMLVIDLASKPGGTDFAAAERLGIKAILAPGLPGLRAPRTAGENLTQVILEILKERGL